MPIRKIFITISIFAIVLPGLAFSQTGTEVAEKPLKIYDAQKFDNQSRQAGLIATYGQSGFDQCFSCAEYDLTNPFGYSACLREAAACLSGSELNNNSCPVGKIRSAGACVNYEEGCRVEYGEHSIATGAVDDSGKVVCECAEGYSWNGLKTKCIESCPDGMLYYSTYKQANGEFLYGRCQTPDDACQSEYGDYSQSAGESESGDYLCRCQDGYIWDNDTCIENVTVLGIESGEFLPDAYETTVFAERALVVNADGRLAQRLRGMILLQVENNGEAWYVNPDDQNKYFLSSPSRAFALMQKLGLGATHAFLTEYTTYPDFVSGKILIDVDDSGKAYYIYPGDKHAYYLGKPSDAFSVMRNLGLGITNENIRKIEVGEL